MILYLKQRVPQLPSPYLPFDPVCPIFRGRKDQVWKPHFPWENDAKERERDPVNLSPQFLYKSPLMGTTATTRRSIEKMQRPATTSIRSFDPIHAYMDEAAERHDGVHGLHIRRIS